MINKTFILLFFMSFLKGYAQNFQSFLLPLSEVEMIKLKQLSNDTVSDLQLSVSLMPNSSYNCDSSIIEVFLVNMKMWQSILNNTTTLILRNFSCRNFKCDTSFSVRKLVLIDFVCYNLNDIVSKFPNIEELELLNYAKNSSLNLNYKHEKISSLNVYSNNISFDSVFFNRPCLKSLKIQGNGRDGETDLLDKIINDTCLQKLDFCYNGLKFIDKKQTYKSKSIQELKICISNNVNQHDLFEFINAMEKITTLHLYNASCNGSRFCFFRKNIKIDKVKWNSKIIELALIGCVKKIPNNIVTLTDLNTLILQHNNLKKLPHFIYDFNNIKLLDLSYNKIREIPDEIAKLKKLEILDISENKNIKISDEILSLENLKIIRYSKNQNIIIDRLRVLMPDCVFECTTVEYKSINYAF
jgi:hypothetical protein